MRESSEEVFARKMEPWRRRIRELLVEHYEHFSGDSPLDARSVSDFVEAVAASAGPELRKRGYVGEAAELFAFERTAQLLSIANEVAGEVYIAKGEARRVNVALLKRLCVSFTNGAHDDVITAAMVMHDSLLEPPSQREALHGTLQMVERFRL